MVDSFDLAAKDYDETFTNTCVGKAQRDQVWKAIGVNNSALSVLEVNCGTGKDANIWHSKGHTILATDGSSEMIKTAQKNYPHVPFAQMNLQNVRQRDETYDILFSNFGGLNCLSPEQLSSFFLDIYSKLNSGGSMQLVIMGKKCLWDQLFLVLKGRKKERSRRNTPNALAANVDGKEVLTWYYSPHDIRVLTEGQYDISKCTPVGLFVPPSYLANAFEKRKFVFRILTTLDKLISFRFLSNYADHYFINLTKKGR